MSPLPMPYHDWASMLHCAPSMHSPIMALTTLCNSLHNNTTVGLLTACHAALRVPYSCGVAIACYLEGLRNYFRRCEDYKSLGQELGSCQNESTNFGFFLIWAVC